MLKKYWNRIQIWEAERQNEYLGSSSDIKASINLEAFFIKKSAKNEFIKKVIKIDFKDN